MQYQTRPWGGGGGVGPARWAWLNGPVHRGAVSASLRI